MTSVMLRPSSHPRLAIGPALLVLVSLAGLGCASRGPEVIDAGRLDEGVRHLSRPLTGNFAALYDLRVASSGGLRLAVLTDDGRGRMTVSEPFGAAVSLTAWSTDGPAVFFDMDQGCRREVDDLEDVLGIDALPLDHAVRLLGGRLPVTPDDRIGRRSDGTLEIRGEGWGTWIRLAADPWRVVEAGELDAGDDRGWHLELGSHTSSVPGRVRVENADGRWAELDLTRLEWPDDVTLPDLPEFEPCAGW